MMFTNQNREGPRCVAARFIAPGSTCEAVPLRDEARRYAQKGLSILVGKVHNRAATHKKVRYLAVALGTMPTVLTF